MLPVLVLLPGLVPKAGGGVPTGAVPAVPPEVLAPVAPWAGDDVTGPAQSTIASVAQPTILRIHGLLP